MHSASNMFVLFQLGSAETMAQVNVIAKSNVVTESEHESALEQISYLETSSVQRSHQVPKNRFFTVKTIGEITITYCLNCSSFFEFLVDKNIQKVEQSKIKFVSRLCPLKRLS